MISAAAAGTRVSPLAVRETTALRMAYIMEAQEIPS